MISGIIIGQEGNSPSYGEIGTSYTVNLVHSNLKYEKNRFYSKNWLSGILITRKNNKIYKQKINYDLINGEIHIKSPNNGKGFIVLDKRITGFILKTSKGEIYFSRIENENFDNYNIDREFFITPMKSLNNNLLIMDYRRVLNESEVPRDGFSDISNLKKYKNRTHYYVLNAKNKYVKVKLKKKHLLQVFSDKKEELINFIKAKKLKPKKIKDAIKIVNYYHSL